MADTTGIEWTDSTWQIITGCTITSPGCANCYAMGLAAGRLRNHPSRAGLTKIINDHAVWTGEVRFNTEWLTQPIQWKRPRKIFVCAHGDLFHESVPDQWIDQVFAVMAMAPQHQFQVLTKRARRMREYVANVSAAQCVARAVIDLHGTPGINGADILRALIHRDDEVAPEAVQWPLPNVWLGVSTEDQKRADERIPELLATHAAVRWISAEPLLGPITIGTGGIDWVVVGGESGADARPMHPHWPRQLRDECAQRGIAFMFKQWGEWSDRTYTVNTSLRHKVWKRTGFVETDRWLLVLEEISRGKIVVARAGKRNTGRLLDGHLHDGYPEIAR